MKTANGTPLRFIRWLDTVRSHALVEVAVRNGGITMVSIGEGILFDDSDADALKADVPAARDGGVYPVVQPRRYTQPPVVSMSLSTTIPDSVTAALNLAADTVAKKVAILLDKAGPVHYHLNVR